MGDQNIAVEFLMNGIPEVIEDEGDEPEGINLGSLTQEQAETIQNFINSDEFRTLREQAQQDPNVIQTLMQNLQTSHPQIHSVLSQNPEILEELLLGSEGSENIGLEPENVAELMNELMGQNMENEGVVCPEGMEYLEGSNEYEDIDEETNNMPPPSNNIDFNA